MIRTLVLIFAMLIPCHGHAHFKLARELAKAALEYDRSEISDPEVDWSEARGFTGYVIGVYDTLGMLPFVAFCPPERAHGGEIFSAISKYLRDNPEQWTRPAAYVVREGLQKSFPCR
jgi:hypothetical protein